MANTTRRTIVRRLIKASAGMVYHAYIDAEAVATWLPPGDMTGVVHEFEPVENGRFSMSLTYPDAPNGVHGKSGDKVDTFTGRFSRLVADREVVWVTTFQSPDPAFAGEMSIRSTFMPIPEGTEVTITCEDVPPGIRLEDNAEGCRQTLAKLAAYLENPQRSLRL